MNFDFKNLDEAIVLLKRIVKYSAVEGQKHLDLTVALAEDRHHFQKALMFVNKEVEAGSLTQDELKKRLGLI